MPENAPVRTAKGHFTKGSSGNPAGRPKGITDKYTASLKQAILMAATDAGEMLGAQYVGAPDGLTKYLMHLALKDHKSFAILLGKVLPLTLANDAANPLLTVETQAAIVAALRAKYDAQ